MRSSRYGLAIAGLLVLSAPHLGGCISESVSEGNPGSEPPPDAPPDAPSCTVEAASVEEVSVANDFGALDGTLSIPEHCGPVPVIVILSGTGQTDRNANGPRGTYQTDAYLMLSDALVDQAQVAVLRYDDHGVGKSKSALPLRQQDFTFQLEIADAARFVRRLRDDGRFSKVLVAGHSLGSLMGTLVASYESIDGSISLEGPGRRACAIFHDQVVDQGAAGSELAEFDAACAKLEQGQLPGELGSGLAGQAFPVATQQYYASYLKYDPAAEFAKLDIPALVVHGTMDQDVALEDATLLHTAKPDSVLAIVEGMAHMLKQADATPSSQRAARVDRKVPLASGLVPELRAFIDAHR